MDELTPKSVLTLDEIEENFKGLDAYYEMMSSIREILKHKEEDHS